MTTIEVELAERFPHAEWDEFVDRHPDGNFFHLSTWGSVYSELPNIRPRFLMARAGGELVGVMPLAIVQWFGQRWLVSSPYCVQAGALGRDVETNRVLEKAALSRAREAGAGALEIRQTSSLNPDWPEIHAFDGFSRALHAADEDNLKAIPRKQRAMIRKGESAGLRSTRDITLAAFYPLYALSMRNLGTPAYSKTLFSTLEEKFKKHVYWHGVEDATGLVAAVLSFHYKDTVLPYYAGALPRARTLKAYDYLYWQLMCDAVRRGCSRFDFGRSVVGSGAWAFKKNWGFAPNPMIYQMVSTGARTVKPLDPESRANRVARAAWRKLPLAVANCVSPWLARRLF